ncbi:S8 family serine peptidase [Actinomadura sp. HBU206391]|uniref:S8 family serine peptidase n=1 Tax=Actinomadura sp. HBU206391 TaxID=2731692 RepID=UPI0016504F77|nr:S8 family serine peptidase [Actinomadura sp. HBU206391]MBC6458269.1 S8 family serine peptidase [Actinomadura sp. HBU206391]
MTAGHSEVVTSTSAPTTCPNCDAEVLRALVDWEGRGADPGDRIDVFVTFDGDVKEMAEAGLDPGHVIGDLVTGSVALADVAKLAATAGVRWIAASARTHLHIDRSMGEVKATALRASSPPYNAGGLPGLTGKGVLVGVIDNRLTVTHPTFVVPNTTPPKSRIIGYWDQFSTPKPGQKPPSQFGFPAGFNYGVWWDEAAVANVVAKNLVDEIWTNAEFDHGTHVAGIAAGNGSGKDGPFAPFTFVGVAPEADIVFANSATLVSSRAVSEAVALFYQLAAQRGAGGVPCVVNMSFGTHEGARDGTSALELAIDKLMHDASGNPVPGRAIVVSAGNEGDTRRHSRKNINAFGNVSFRLEVEEIVFPNGSRLSEDRVDDQLYFWYDGAARIELRLTPPRSTPSAWTQPGQQSVISIGGTPVATVVSPPQPDPNNGKRKIDVTLNGPVRKGIWKIELHEIGGAAAAAVDVWVERENIDVWPQFGFGDIITDNTVESPSTARSVVAVGAYVSEPGSNFSAYGSIAESSSRGLDSASGVPPDRVRPHLVAPGRRIISAAVSQEMHPQDIKVRFGGWLLNRHVIFSGTSQAAPHVAGVIALMFQKNPTLTYRDVRQILAATTKKDQIPPELVLPNAVWGAGKLDAAAALAATPVRAS